MRSLFAGLVAAVLLAAPLAEAVADDTGVAQLLHSVRREGRNLCLSDHFHDGHSSGEATRKAAELAAIKAWAEFTNWEYGTDWARWQKAASKRMTCSQSGPTSWSCHAEARPCK